MNVLGIGTEIVECLRIAKMIERHGDCSSTASIPRLKCVLPDSQAGHATFAGHWAAKEAIRKALGTEWQRGVGWHVISKSTTTSWANRSSACAADARDIVVSRGVREIQVSISHAAATRWPTQWRWEPRLKRRVDR